MNRQSPIPPDDLQRRLAVARPNDHEKLPHIALMGLPRDMAPAVNKSEVGSKA